MGNIFRRSNIFFLLVIGLMSSVPVSAQTPQVVCIASSGDLIVRKTKCLSSEKKASIANLVQTGAKGATGATGGSGVQNRRVEIFSDLQRTRAQSPAVSISTCDSAEALIGGGCGAFAVSGGIPSSSSSSGPIPVSPGAGAREGWRCAFTGVADRSGLYNSYAICADAN
jgi:hypothetical protein